jgi:rod shape determining protein RodA
MQRRHSVFFPFKALLQPWLAMDWWLLFLVIGLTVLGGVMIRSVELNYGWTDWWQHWVIGGIGLSLALVIACLQYEGLLRWHWLIYGLMNVSLLIVAFAGTEELGAQRWLSIAGFNVQPSEFAKLGLIITLAALLHDRPANSLLRLLQILGVASLPWAFVFLEPNLGTSLVIGAITFGMLYWGGANPGWLLLLISPLLSLILFKVSLVAGCIGVLVTGVVALLSLPWPRIGAFAALTINLTAGLLGPNLLNLVIKPYQKVRLLCFRNPDADPAGCGFQLIQSRIAVGAGEFWGRGLFQGSQTQLNYVPEQHTDFIFTAVGEELGFVGSVLVLLAFWLICLRLIIIAQNARNRFGSLIAIGVLSMLLFQAVVNIGMTIGLSPVTGIPLPWLSYGRSSLLMNFLALGIVESVANHRQRMRF